MILQKLCIILTMNDHELRKHLIEGLTSGSRMSFDEAIADFPEEHMSTKAPNVHYSFWHILEHMRRLQADVLDFSINSKYTFAGYEMYWPEKDATCTKEEWDKTIADFKKDLETFKALVGNEKTDLFAKIPWGQGQTILREALVLIDHNSYHIGEFAVLRSVVGAWPKDRKE